MENNNKRNKIVTLTVIGIIVLLIVLVGATYAYFSAKSKTDPQTINTAKVDLLVEIDEEATHI